MGERKGQNMYYPPDYDPRKGGLNKSQGTHALRERARKLHLGILIIRFEMPYNIWCEGCGNHIGMGVRYNAEKKKVGMYYTTPIYLFRMKCHLCTNHFEIKTDPANLDYEIISGARRQEKRFKAEENGTVVPEERSAIAKLATDSMFKLQHDGIDRGKGKDAAPTIGKIVQIQDRRRDDYSANRQLRDTLRAKRKAAKAIAISNESLLSRTSLQGSGVKLLPEDDSDSKTAALLRLAPTSTPEDRQNAARDAIMEDGSIFNFVRASSSKETTKSESINTKHIKIENFKKIVARKRHRDGMSALQLNLGIRKKVNTKKSKDNLEQQQHSNQSDEKQVTNAGDIDIKSVCDTQNGNLERLPIENEKSSSLIRTENRTSPCPNLEELNTLHTNCTIMSSIEEDSNKSKDLRVCDEKGDSKSTKHHSLALLSCDYGGSNSSSDSE